MAKGYMCDRCGAAIFEGEQTSFNVEMKGEVNKATTEGFDLCPKCAVAVHDIISNRIITTKTRPGAWEDEDDA